MSRYGLQETTKTRKVRFIPMNESCYESLIQLYNSRSSLNFVFLNQFGRAIDYQHFSYRDFSRSLEKAGVKKIRFHDLRTTDAANYCMSGGDIYPLSKILGHSTVEMTQKRYAHLHPSYLKEQSNIVNFKIDARVNGILKLVKESFSK